jgi:hypothetical protein
MGISANASRGDIAGSGRLAPASAKRDAVEDKLDRWILNQTPEGRIKAVQTEFDPAKIRVRQPAQ